MSIDVEQLIHKVQSTADWRREKALQFPGDYRNREAAEKLDTLAAELESLQDSEIAKQILELGDRILQGDNDENFRLFEEENEEVSSALRDVGFRGGFGTGIECLEWYRDLLQEKLCDRLDAAAPVPDLDEQVANDPAVRAAKQAYDNACAEAYAKARKKL